MPPLRTLGTLAAMKCWRCGHDNPSGAKFCSSCGAPLTGEEEATAQLQAVEDRLELEEEWGDLIAELPTGVGMLVVRRGPNAGSRYLLEDAETSAGRHPDSDIFLDDITVSRRHAVVARRDGGYRVTDVGSLNGTYVNHERRDEGPLVHGDELQIGRFVLLFVVGAAS